MNDTEQRIPTASPHDRFTPETVRALNAPLNEKRVAVDPRGNPYLEGWDVIAAANHYFGFDGWSSAVQGVECTARTDVTRTDRKTGEVYQVEIAVYSARVMVTAGGASRTDVGTGITADDRPEAHETAIKGAVTDGLKRALRQFGNQFGNGLYDKGRTTAETFEPEAEAHRPPATAPARAPAPAPRPAQRPPTNGQAEWWTRLMTMAREQGVRNTQIASLVSIEGLSLQQAARKWLNEQTSGEDTAADLAHLLKNAAGL